MFAATGRLCILALSLSTSLAIYADTINVGYVAFDVTNAPLGEFDISNQTGPNSSPFPDPTFPVANSVSFTGLSLTVNFQSGSPQIFGSSYFTLAPDGFSFTGGDIFNQTNDPVTSATLKGSFGTSNFTLNDGSTSSVDSTFAATLIHSGGTLQDGDLALITASTGSSSVTPEPAGWVLLVIGLALLGFLRLSRKLRGRFAVLLAGLVACTLSLTAQSSVRLNSNTLPDSGVSGSTKVWVAGTGFPTGTLTTGNLAVSLAGSCGGSDVTPGVALAVQPVIGSSNRIEFLVPASLATGTYYVSLNGTTSAGNSFASANCSQLSVTHTNTTFSSCNPGSSMGMLVPNASGTGTTPVVAYVPNGFWSGGTSGVRVVPIEGSGSTSVAPTAKVVNSCSSNSATDETVCVGNDTSIYLITGNTVNSTLSSSADTSASFSGGSCSNCGVAVNSVTNQAVITIGMRSANSGSGLQFLDLATNALGAPVPSQYPLTEDVLWDPFRSSVLSPNYDGGGGYDLFRTSGNSLPSASSVTEFHNATVNPGYYPDSAGEDCTTGIALSTSEGTGNLYITDLSQANYSSSAPFTWSAPAQVQVFPEFENLSAGTSGIAVAPGSTHLGIVAGEFGGNGIGVILLPATSGTGMPAVVDYVYATLPNTPDQEFFETGYDPHTTTAYTSPNNGKAYGVMASWASGEPSYLAIVDLQALLAAPRTGAHTVNSSYDLVANGIVRYVKTQ